MKHLILTIGCLTVLIANCKNLELKQAQTKMDLALKRMMAVEKNKDILFVGESTRPISPSMQRAMLKTGIDLQTVLNRLFTAKGTPDEVISLAQLTFIKRLEASKQLNDDQ